MITRFLVIFNFLFLCSSSLSATDTIPDTLVDGDEVQVYRSLQSRRSFRGDNHAYVLRIDEHVEVLSDDDDDDDDDDFLKNLKSFQIENFGELNHYWSAVLVEVRESLGKEIWPLESDRPHPTIEVGSSVRILMAGDLKIGDRISCGKLFAFSIPGEPGQAKQNIYFAANLHPVVAQKDE